MAKFTITSIIDNWLLFIVDATTVFPFAVWDVFKFSVKPNWTSSFNLVYRSSQTSRSFLDASKLSRDLVKKKTKIKIVAEN